MAKRFDSGLGCHISPSAHHVPKNMIELIVRKEELPEHERLEKPLVIQSKHQAAFIRELLIGYKSRVVASLLPEVRVQHDTKDAVHNVLLGMIKEAMKEKEVKEE